MFCWIYLDKKRTKMLAPFIVFTQRTFQASGYIKKKKKNGCAVPNSVMGCIQLCPEKDLKHWQKPDVISQHVLSRLNAPSCSLALGHSITKYCFSTCYTKRFLKAAGRRAGGLTIGHCLHRVVCRPNAMSEERDPGAPVHLWASGTFFSFGKRTRPWFLRG